MTNPSVYVVVARRVTGQTCTMFSGLFASIRLVQKITPLALRYRYDRVIFAEGHSLIFHTSLIVTKWV